MAVNLAAFDDAIGRTGAGLSYACSQKITYHLGREIDQNSSRNAMSLGR
jgi:hypothetical protein